MRRYPPAPQGGGRAERSEVAEGGTGGVAGGAGPCTGVSRSLGKGESCPTTRLLRVAGQRALLTTGGVLGADAPGPKERRPPGWGAHSAVLTGAGCSGGRGVRQSPSEGDVPLR
jgi:hypothetical protein